MNRQKPHRERQLGLFEQRTANQQGLVMALCALIQVAGLDYAMATTTAAKALKPG